ncbi:hypothetical protein Bbelb_268630 [Branchiostoma belcheri]|nr:hypothetical protein Bbelb_268630 [Branchiostoma belcheri]
MPEELVCWERKVCRSRLIVADSAQASGSANCFLQQTNSHAISLFGRFLLFPAASRSLVLVSSSLVSSLIVVGATRALSCPPHIGFPDIRILDDVVFADPPNILSQHSVVLECRVLLWTLSALTSSPQKHSSPCRHLRTPDSSISTSALTPYEWKHFHAIMTLLLNVILRLSRLFIKSHLHAAFSNGAERQSKITVAKK